MLLEAWKVEGVNQTIAAELAYADLTENFEASKFYKRVEELNSHLATDKSKRLAARIMLYKMQGKPGEVSVDELWQCILQAAELNDEQLLSEMYAKYAEIKAPQSEKLYYLLKALQIQERIGVKYFKHIYFRYLTVGGILYRIDDFKRSLAFGLKGIKVFNHKNNYALDYVYLLDLAGASYKNLGQADSALVQYNKLADFLRDYERAPQNYSPKKLDKYYLNIWKGIADGGIGRSLMVKHDYERAMPFLMSNLDTVIKYGEFGNAASVLNVMANAHLQKNHISRALTLFQRAYNYELKANEYYHLEAKLETAEGLTKAFSALKMVDSAYLYLQQYNLLKDSVQKEANDIRFSETNTELEFEIMQKKFSETQYELSKQKMLRNAIILGIFLSTVVALLLYNAKLLKYKVQEEKLSKEKELAQKEVAYAKAKLEAFISSISEKNKLIEDLQNHYQMKESADELFLSDISILTDDDWNNFKNTFTRVYPSFLKEVKRIMPDISLAEQRFLALSKLNMPTKEMAAAQGITQDSVRKQRYRLRKRLESISSSLTLESFLAEN